MRWVEIEHEHYIPLPANTWCSGCANALSDDMAKSPITPRISGSTIKPLRGKAAEESLCIVQLGRYPLRDRSALCTVWPDKQTLRRADDGVSKTDHGRYFQLPVG